MRITKIIRQYKSIGSITLLLILSNGLMAQKDTIPQQITIVTEYKPVARSVAKINLTGSNIYSDTSKQILAYQIPVQQLFYAYQPISLNPLSMDKGDLINKGDRLMVKAGFGTFRTPLLQAATYLGDVKTFLCNMNVDYLSSKGRIDNQDFSNLKVKTSASYFLSGHELYSTVGYDRTQHFLYGYNHDLYSYQKSEISQLVQQFCMSAGVRNTADNSLDIRYNPNVSFSLFRMVNQLRETNFLAELPVEKSFNDKLFLKLAAKADLTSYSTTNLIPDNIDLKNNIIILKPEIHYHANRLKIHGGVNYFNDNGKSFFLPNISAEFSLSKDNLIFQAGWIGDVQKNNFASLNSVNPYLGFITKMNNTQQTEIYGGLKMSLIKHVLFTAKASYIRYNDFQFFINDTSSDQTMRRFLIVNESTLNNFRIHGDISYIIRDKFDLTGGLTINGYTGMKDNAKAWHMIPLEFNTSMKWKIIDRLTLKSQFYLFAGGHYLERNNTSGSLGGGADFSAGLDFRINRHFTVFTDLNNIFGQKYQRWHNYPVYGFNAMIGAVARF